MNADLSEDLRDRVLEKLGLSGVPYPDEQGLRQLYGAWCYQVPFDNLRKMTAMLSAADGALPGSDAADFFEAWLNRGTGGTCWPSSNALYSLFASCGFHVRRVAASIHDTGERNHGSVKASLKAGEWLLDSSILTIDPLLLEASPVETRSALMRREIEPLDGTWLVRFESLPLEELVRCRLLDDPVDGAFYHARYEHSRTAGPFNHRLYARRNRPGEVRVLSGHMRYVKTAEGLLTQKLAAAELKQAMTEDIGFAPPVVNEWAETGALALSMREVEERSPAERPGGRAADTAAEV